MAAVEPSRQNLEQSAGQDGTPLHLGVIMDGNGRWAKARGLPRTAGHKRGADAARRTVTAAAKMGVRYLTLYSFSSENWKRPIDEVNDLMGLLGWYLKNEVRELHKNGIRLRVIGERSRLDREILDLIEEGEGLTRANARMDLIMALSYGSRQEMISAMQDMARAVAEGRLTPEEIDQRAFEERLWTGDIPDPDLILRTSGEQRLSNFLLWQSAYSELMFVDCLWPDFGEEELVAAIEEFRRRAGATVQASRPDKPGGGLLPRVLAALILAPPVLLALYVGSPYLDVLVFAGLAVVAAEWALLCDHQRKGAVLAVMLPGTLASLFALRQLGLEPGLGVLAVCAAVVTLVGQRSGASPRLLILGVIYLPAACFSFLWLRDQPQGLALAFWVMTAVWATDIGAYAAGCGIGGPKLLPSISPKKTWAGLIGGMAAAGLLSVLAALLVAPWEPLTLVALGCLLAVVAQMGDFVESALKRYFGVKDASSLIPGHGGLLDRVDGLLMASLGVAALVQILREGGHGGL